MCFRDFEAFQAWRVMYIYFIVYQVLYFHVENSNASIPLAMLGDFCLNNTDKCIVFSC